MKKILCVFFALFVWGIAEEKLVVAVENEPSRLNPIFSEDHDVAIGVIFSGLVRLGQNAEVLPDLSVSWEIKDLEYTFTLRENVKWHDGKPFSIDDVIFTLNALKNTKFNSPLKVNFDMIKDIKKLSETKLQITLNQPFPPFLEVMSVGILPKHLLQNENLNQTPFNFSPIGTGAYKLKEWKKGQYMILEANPDFYLGKVQTPHLILKKISNPSVVAMELKSGNIDAGLVDFELASSFKNDPRFGLIFLSSADYRALMFNFNNPLFQDKELRIAFNYAINKEAMLQKLIHSYGMIAHHPLQVSWANPKQYPTFEYDPKKAMEILQKLGWQKNKEGILQKQDKLLSFDIYTMNDDPLRVALASVLQSDLANIGVHTKVVAKPSGSFDYTKTDSFIVGWGSPLDPDLHTYRVFASFEDVDFNLSGWNFGHYRNKYVDESLMLARSTLDIQKRKQHYANFISAINADPPFIFLLYLQFPFVYHTNIQGIKPNIVGHHGVGFTWNIWEWQKN